MRLEGKRAIITGGGQGLGRGMAHAFAKEGARIVIAQRTAEKLEQVAREVEALGGEVHAIATDVGKEADVRAMIDLAEEKLGGLDVLVNNAGVGLRVPIEELDMADYDRLMDTNLRGLFLGVRLGVPLLKAAGGGSIINIASVHGVEGMPLNTVYAATKGGIIGATRAMAAELAPHRIRANVISPGAIHLEHYMNRLLSRIDEADRERFLTEMADDLEEMNTHRFYQPLEQVGMPVDIAMCAVYLASDESAFVTGQNITVDGGLTTAMKPWAMEEGREKARPARERVERWVVEYEKQRGNED